jgi:hypothetical protein
MASWVAGVTVADTGVGAIVGPVETDPIMRVAALDPLDVAGDLTQHRAAPRDLGPDHVNDLLNRCRRWKGHKLGASIPHRQTLLSTWRTWSVSIKNLPLDTYVVKSYCCLPSKPRGLEVSRSSSGVLMGDDDGPQDAASLSLTG